MWISHERLNTTLYMIFFQVDLPCLIKITYLFPLQIKSAPLQASCAHNRSQCSICASARAYLATCPSAFQRRMGSEFIPNIIPPTTLTPSVTLAHSILYMVCTTHHIVTPFYKIFVKNTRLLSTQLGRHNNLKVRFKYFQIIWKYLNPYLLMVQYMQIHLIAELSV